MTGKIQLHRWQWDEVEYQLCRRVPYGDVVKIMTQHFERIYVEPRFKDMPIVYVYFGYRNAAEQWCRDNGVAIKDMVIARDWEKLAGRRGRPKPIYDMAWFRLNYAHDITRRAQEQMYRLEALYGSAPNETTNEE